MNQEEEQDKIMDRLAELEDEYKRLITGSIEVTVYNELIMSRHKLVLYCQILENGSCYHLHRRWQKPWFN